MDYLAYSLAFIWGGIWAAVLQFSAFGRWLAVRRTWLTVVIGVGVDLLILLWLLDWQAWLTVSLVISLSSVAIIFRSLWNAHRENMENLDVKNAPSK